jgi:hypothetical protein
MSKQTGPPATSKQIPNPHNRTLTVGPGITPSLLSLLPAQQAPAGYTLLRDYRRWGLPPRPENPHKWGTKRD